MIRVFKLVRAPAHLLRGVAPTSAHCTAFDAESLSYVEGFNSFDFDNNIYGHALVKGALKAAQHGKCCYCEARFSATSAGDVEHFRPKKGARQDVGYPVEHPGYYWLAYSWQNLYFCCGICNQQCKKNFFPLSEPSKRARFHSDNISDEDPLILDPGGPDDPRDHIRFHGEVPEGMTAKGKQTVKTLKLDRLALNEERFVEAKRIRELKRLIKAIEANPSPQFASILDDARKYLADSVKPDAIYSAMAQDLLR